MDTNKLPADSMQEATMAGFGSWLVDMLASTVTLTVMPVKQQVHRQTLSQLVGVGGNIWACAKDQAKNK